tara:strand:- start:129 stop:812 length:684 start_codon:yes stop_codon:yes gene_type:complete
MNYIPYYRISTIAQQKSGLGLEAQVDCVKHFVSGRGGRILTEFTEVESGCSSSRPELTKAIREAKLTSSVLVIAKLCRLSRNVHFLTGLQRSGVEFVCCDMPDANNVTVQLMAVLAENEAKLISVRTKEALAAAKRRGIKLGNPNLSDVRNTDTKSANNVRVKKADVFALEVTEIIKEIYRNDGFTRSVDIASALNARGIKTSRGCEWTSVQVLRIANRIATIESRK